MYNLPGPEELLFDDYEEVEEAPEDESLMEKVVDGFHYLLEKQKTKIMTDSKGIEKKDLELES